jgi:hypothetical protein
MNHESPYKWRHTDVADNEQSASILYSSVFHRYKMNFLSFEGHRIGISTNDILQHSNGR